MTDEGKTDVFYFIAPELTAYWVPSKGWVYGDDLTEEDREELANLPKRIGTVQVAPDEGEE